MKFSSIEATPRGIQTRHRGVGQLARAFVVLSVWIASPILAFAPSSGAVPDQYIIKLRPNEHAADVANEMALSHGLGVGHVYRHALNGFSARVPQGRLNHLLSDRSEERRVGKSEVV